MAREINLVPDVKGEMIKALKLRNIIFFLCIIVAVASISVTVITGLIMGGQQLALDNRKSTLDSLSTKLNSYSDLSDFLTIKDQVGDISTLNNNKKVLSRTFNILSALIPTGADTITVSELSVNLADSQTAFSFDAQANAGKEPYIDYQVLESFKKSMQFMRYDYGQYVDKNGATIPAYCMIESGEDGATFTDSSKGIYAFWTINAEGCNPSAETTNASNYSTEDYDGQQVVRIWRTPQSDDWYKQNQVEGQPYMGLDGQISGVEHFESACISYRGNIGGNSTKPEWTAENTSCLLVPDGTNGIKVSDSSNGRGSDDELVLRFSATISLAPEVYDFTNSHMLAIAPTGRRNVTDSYVQIQAMFGERAKDCEEDDTACSTNTNNATGENNNG